jgi:hypothetical protein
MSHCWSWKSSDEIWVEMAVITCTAKTLTPLSHSFCAAACASFVSSA